MGYGRKHQHGTDGELWRAVVTYTYHDHYRGEDKEAITVLGPYTTRGAAANAAAQQYWPRRDTQTVVVEKLTTAEWLPVNKSGEVVVTVEEHRELRALRALRAQVEARGWAFDVL